MTEEKQRIAIAELCGWSISYHTDTAAYGVLNYEEDGMAALYGEIPDYLNDLNAMNRAEKILYPPFCSSWCKWQIYEDYLSQVLDSRFIARATAPQRAKAFLLTLNLWKK